jgi:hypothetical protein
MVRNSNKRPAAELPLHPEGTKRGNSESFTKNHPKVSKRQLYGRQQPPHLVNNSHSSSSTSSHSTNTLISDKATTTSTFINTIPNNMHSANRHQQKQRQQHNGSNTSTQQPPPKLLNATCDDADTFRPDQSSHDTADDDINYSSDQDESLPKYRDHHNDSSCSQSSTVDEASSDTGHQDNLIHIGQNHHINMLAHPDPLHNPNILDDGGHHAAPNMVHIQNNLVSQHSLPVLPNEDASKLQLNMLKHRVQAYVRDHLFTKVKFITHDELLQYSGKLRKMV